MENALIYMAPMEGITGYLYRNTYHKYFEGVDKYFMPFIAPAKGRPLRNRELKDVLPDNNVNIDVVPQLLTNSGEGFVRAAEYLKEFGYTEVNINLGCPSNTVVSKCKGSGLLYDTERLDNFLYEVFSADVMDVSIKTRIGKESPAEFEDLIDIYKKYPVKELIIHPRVQKDFYKNSPRMDAFQEGLCRYGRTDNVCYNGDIWGISEYEQFRSSFPNIGKIMIGRGIISNPFLPGDIKARWGHGSSVIEKPSNEKIEIFFDFHDELYCKYCESDVGRGNTLFKMKELWAYMGNLFVEPDSDEVKEGKFCAHGAGRLLKKIRKSGSNNEYEIAVKNLKNVLIQNGK